MIFVAFIFTLHTMQNESKSTLCYRSLLFVIRGLLPNVAVAISRGPALRFDISIYKDYIFSIDMNLGRQRFFFFFFKSSLV